MVWSVRANEAGKRTSTRRRLITSEAVAHTVPCIDLAITTLRRALGLAHQRKVAVVRDAHRLAARHRDRPPCAVRVTFCQPDGLGLNEVNEGPTVPCLTGWITRFG